MVLVDTAGRMQDNEPLMRALAKLICVNSPDLVLFVGEALVGNEAVDQLVKFNRALVDYSEEGNTRTIDGIVLTKFDTIDDKVTHCSKLLLLYAICSCSLCLPSTSGVLEHKWRASLLLNNWF